MSPRGLEVLLLASLVASCGGDSGSSGGSSGSDDATAVGIADFDTSKGTSLDEAALSEAVSDVSAPIAIAFSNMNPGTGLALSDINGGLTAVLGFELANSFSDCVDNTAPLVDVVTASGSSATQQYKVDWSKCLSDSIIKSGGTVTATQCGISFNVSVDCPGMDYSAANGLKSAEALKFLGNGMAGCKLAAGVKGSSTAKMVSTCMFVGTQNGKNVSLNIQQRAAFLGASGSACQFETVGKENVLKDCFDATSKKTSNTYDSRNSNEQIVHRVKLTGATHAHGSTRFSSGQTFAFDLNDWSGSLTSGSYSMTYILKNGAKTKSGTLY